MSIVQYTKQVCSNIFDDTASLWRRFLIILYENSDHKIGYLIVASAGGGYTDGFH